MNVQKSDGRIEPFDREKIALGIRLSANNRISDCVVEEIVDKVETRLFETCDGNIPSRKIGNLVIRSLKKVDEIAYLRFASVYKNFKDLNSFEQELIKLKK
jgi:transcriptional repressor NrdR